MFTNRKLKTGALGLAVKMRMMPAGNDIVRSPVILTRQLKPKHTQTVGRQITLCWSYSVIKGFVLQMGWKNLRRTGCVLLLWSRHWCTLWWLWQQAKTPGYSEKWDWVLVTNLQGDITSFDNFICHCWSLDFVGCWINKSIRNWIPIRIWEMLLCIRHACT